MSKPYQMSCYIHDPRHIQALVSNARQHELKPTAVKQGYTIDPGDDQQAALLVKILYADNVRSYNERYDEQEPVLHELECVKTPLLLKAAFYKAINSYIYQSCETSDWKQTVACQVMDDWCDQLEKKLERNGDQIRNLQEYDKANTWSIRA